MSDQAPAQHFDIQTVYLKDVSLESPNVPMIFGEQGQPEINLQLGNASAKLADDVYEVVLTLTVTAKLEEKTLYLVEVQQAGVFTLKGFTSQQLGRMLGAYCPSSLFPFAREAITSLIGKAGFAPVLLSPINFDALYNQHVTQQAQDQGDQPVAQPPH